MDTLKFSSIVSIAEQALDGPFMIAGYKVLTGGIIRLKIKPKRSKAYDASIHPQPDGITYLVEGYNMADVLVVLPGTRVSCPFIQGRTGTVTAMDGVGSSIAIVQLEAEPVHIPVGDLRAVPTRKAAQRLYSKSWSNKWGRKPPAK